MHRIDTSTAQKDKFGAGKNGFTTGDPQSGTPATEVSADILDALQEEIAAVIEDPDSGLELNKSDNGQLIAAIKKIITSKSAPDASETEKGIARFATAAESAPSTEAAASQSLAASIARVFSVLRSGAAEATNTLRGTAQLATQEQIDSRAHVAAIVTPDKLRELGVNQAWTDLTSSRALSTTYTNSSGRPIFVSVVSIQPVSDISATFTVDGKIISRHARGQTLSSQITMSALVPAGSTYNVYMSISMLNWFELR